MGVHGVRHAAHKTNPQAHVGRDDRSAGCLAHGRADGHAHGRTDGHTRGIDRRARRRNGG